MMCVSLDWQNTVPLSGQPASRGKDVMDARPHKAEWPSFSGVTVVFLASWWETLSHLLLCYCHPDPLWCKTKHTTTDPIRGCSGCQALLYTSVTSAIQEAEARRSHIKTAWAT